MSQGMTTQDAAMKLIEVIWPTGTGTTCAPHVALEAICASLNAAQAKAWDEGVRAAEEKWVPEVGVGPNPYRSTKETA